MRIRPDYYDYLHMIRRKEAEIVLEKSYPGKSCLEIGAGDGFLSSILKQRFKSVTATDVEKRRFSCKGVRFVECGAEKLPFPDNSFDYIISFHVLEHLTDRRRALSEFLRVLKKGGRMIHVMPSRTYKMMHFVFYYPYLASALLDDGERSRIRREKLEQGMDDNARNRRGNAVSMIIKHALPIVHGEYDNHVSEFIAYGEDRWKQMLSDAGFKVRTRKVCFFSGYAFGLDRAREFLDKAGLASSIAYYCS